MKRFLIIGQERASKSDLRKPAWSNSQAARRLWSWFGLDESEFYDKFDTTNVRDRGFEIKACNIYQKIILLGRVAEKAVLSHIGVIPRREGKYYILPHPSGRNRILNNKTLELKVRRTCQKILKEMK